MNVTLRGDGGKVAQYHLHVLVFPIWENKAASSDLICATIRQRRNNGRVNSLASLKSSSNPGTQPPSEAKYPGHASSGIFERREPMKKLMKDHIVGL